MFQEIEDVILIGNDLYAKNHEALTQLLEFLKKEYEVVYTPKGRYDIRIKESIVAHKRKCSQCGSFVDFQDDLTHQETCGGIIYGVVLCQGKEYNELEKLPVYEWYSIKEAWYWAPLSRSSTLHEDILGAIHMPSEISFYDQRQAFYPEHMKRMRTFVENFTYLDINGWDRMIRKTHDRSGPGLIEAIAEFCRP